MIMIIMMMMMMMMIIFLACGNVIVIGSGITRWLPLDHF